MNSMKRTMPLCIAAGVFNGSGSRRTASWPRLLGAEDSGATLGLDRGTGLMGVPSLVVHNYRGETCLKRVRSHG